MNDTAIKNFAIWARRELISDVQKRCMKYGILEKGSLPGAADTIDGRVLTSSERQQRAELLRLAAAGGYRELVERAAYTWFNRLLAIRFMELNGRLPSHIRVLSGADGAFRPQALTEAMDLPLEALDQTQVAELVQRGDDEALFRAIFLAQCDELAACMPAVFDKIGGSMELLLPDGLLREGGIVEKLVTSIPEEDWREGVEIVDVPVLRQRAKRRGVRQLQERQEGRARVHSSGNPAVHAQLDRALPYGELSRAPVDAQQA